VTGRRTLLALVLLVAPLAAQSAKSVDPGALADAIDVALKQDLPIHELLIERGGERVIDLTFAPFPKRSRHDLASVTKSITSLLIGAAIHAGALRDANVTLGEVFSGLDTAHGAIRVADLLGMQSGMDCGFGRGEVELNAMKRTRNWIEYALHLPMRGAPGQVTAYCSPNYHILSAIISRRTGMSEAEFARKTLFVPLGIKDWYWPSDAQGITHGWGDLQLHARDLVKIGELMLHQGQWRARQIVSPAWVKWSTTAHSHYKGNDWYAYGWWTHPDAPPGFFEAIGRGGQRLSVLPSKDAIIVIFGGGFEPGILAEHLFRSVADVATPTEESTRRLDTAIRAAQTRPIGAAGNGVADCAKPAIGRTYKVASNSLGLQEFSMGCGTLRLQLADRMLNLPAKPAFTLAARPIDGIVPMSRGRWVNAKEFLFELDLLGKVDYYALDITFADRSATLTIRERTGLMSETVAAQVINP